MFLYFSFSTAHWALVGVPRNGMQPGELALPEMAAVVITNSSSNNIITGKGLMQAEEEVLEHGIFVTKITVQNIINNNNIMPTDGQEEEVNSINNTINTI
jgi:hypothetical protein